MLSLKFSPQQRASTTVTTPSPSQPNTRETFLSLPNNETHHLLSGGQNNNNITVKRKLSSQSSSKNCCCCTKNSCIQHNKRRSASLPNLSIKIPKRKIFETKSVLNIVNTYNADTHQNATNSNRKLNVGNSSLNTKCNNGQRRCHNNNNNERRLADRMSFSTTGITTTITTPTHDGNVRSDINDNNISVRVPIIGYEVMEERAKFTVTKTKSFILSLYNNVKFNLRRCLNFGLKCHTQTIIGLYFVVTRTLLDYRIN